ncbi:MAG TPA: DUF4783 domain-containing protein [Chitinophagaceae bacterium]|nr:DUF4783 domain-containing protein [Chitinophagaceae bacterium]
MKTLIASFLLGSIIALSSFAQRSNIDEVIGALRNGNATDLSSHFDETVDLTLPDQTDTYSKAQALLILKDFFNNNGVKAFDVKHKGDNGGGQFCIGTLQTRSGNFRTTVFMKVKNSKDVVKEIRFQSIE